MKLYSPLPWLPFVMVSVLGCGGGSLPPQSDPDEARKLLIVALEAWKGGETANTLAARQPPLYFNDLIADHRLISYTIADGHEMYGLSVRLRATLSLKLPDGSTKERKVTYLVDTAPVLVIVQG